MICALFPHCICPCSSVLWSLWHAFHRILLTRLLFFSNYHPEIAKNDTDNHLFAGGLPCFMLCFLLAYRRPSFPPSLSASRSRGQGRGPIRLFSICLLPLPSPRSFPPHVGAIEFCHFPQEHTEDPQALPCTVGRIKLHMSVKMLCIYWFACGF